MSLKGRSIATTWLAGVGAAVMMSFKGSASAVAGAPSARFVDAWRDAERRFQVLTAATLSALVAFTAVPSAEARPQRVVSYALGTAGATTSSSREFSRIVDATLNSTWGGSLGGSVQFRRGARGAFRVTLATPSVVGSYGGCSRYYSCRSGYMVLINEARWKGATLTYPGPSLRHPYRQLVINHEVGHVLGFGHAGCSGVSKPAPVMQQQSKGLGGCKRNPWPTAGERAALARTLGVAVRRPPSRLVLGRRVGVVELGDKRSLVLSRIGQPQKVHPTDSGHVARYTRLRIAVGYRGGRAAEITTRFSDDSSRAGISVGMRFDKLEKLLPSLRCDASSTSDKRVCVHGRATSAGDTPTTFLGRDGIVSAIRVQRLFQNEVNPDAAG